MTKGVKIEHRGGLGGLAWFGGWLFSIGFLKLSFWKGALALIAWPYFLGAHFSDVPPAPGEKAPIERAGAGEPDRPF
jgi:hypothetical protein